MITPIELFIVLIITACALPLAALIGYALAMVVLHGLVFVEDAIHRVRGVFG